MPKNAPAGPVALITGGGGFLGSAIAAQLVARGRRVISLSRRRHAGLDELGVAQISADVCDLPALENAFRGVGVVYHTAAKAGVWGDAEDYRRINVDGTRNVLAACRRSGVAQLVYTSSPSVVFDGRDICGADESIGYARRRLSAYQASKIAAERAVFAAAGRGLAVAVLRPHLIWGPGDNHLVPRIIARARRLVQVGDGRNLVDTTYIENAAAAHVLAADRLAADPAVSGRVYFISQGAPVRLWEMINRILAAAGLAPVGRRMSARSAWLLGFLLEAVYRALHLSAEPPMTRFVAHELATSHWFDISAARRDLGYVPRVSTEEGLQRLAAWLREKDSPAA